MSTLSYSDFAIQFTQIDANKFNKTGERKVVSTYDFSLLSCIVRSYNLSANSLEVELSVTEDFHDRTRWLLDRNTEPVLPAFTIRLLNSQGKPILVHTGVARTCSLEPHTSGHKADLATESEEPFDLVAILVFKDLKGIELFQPYKE